MLIPLSGDENRCISEQRSCSSKSKWSTMARAKLLILTQNVCVIFFRSFPPFEITLASHLAGANYNGRIECGKLDEYPILWWQHHRTLSECINGKVRSCDPNWYPFWMRALLKYMSFPTEKRKKWEWNSFFLFFSFCANKRISEFSPFDSADRLAKKRILKSPLCDPKRISSIRSHRICTFVFGLKL